MGHAYAGNGSSLKIITLQGEIEDRILVVEVQAGALLIRGKSVCAMFAPKTLPLKRIPREGAKLFLRRTPIAASERHL